MRRGCVLLGGRGVLSGVVG